MRDSVRLGAVFAALILIPALADIVYRWVSDEGVVQFSDTPPADVQARADWRRRDAEYVERHRATGKQRDDSTRRLRLDAELESIAQGAGTPVPGETFAIPDFQRSVLAGLVTAEQALRPDCAQHRVVATEALDRNMDERTVTERWVLDRCGERVSYRVQFTGMQQFSTFDPQASPRDVGARNRGGVAILLDEASSSFTISLEKPGEG